MASQIIRGNNWEEHFINLGNDKAQCIRCVQIYSQMSSNIAWKVHLIYNHEVPAVENMAQYCQSEIPFNLAWKLTTKLEYDYAQCILCYETYICKSIENAVIHLTTKHPEVIKVLRDDITQSWLGDHFNNFYDSYAICKHCKNCFTYFLGRQGLINHLISHNIFCTCNICVRTNENIASTSSHQVGTQLQTAESREEQQRQMSSNKACKVHLKHYHKVHAKENMGQECRSEIPTNLIWKYTTQERVKSSHAQCILCYETYSSNYWAKNTANHLIRKHPEVIKVLKDDIKLSCLTDYFNFSWQCDCCVICKNCKRHFTIFLGRQGLINHLISHNIFRTCNTSVRTNENIASTSSHQAGKQLQTAKSQEEQQRGSHETYEFPTTHAGVASSSFQEVDTHFQTEGNQETQERGSHETYEFPRTHAGVASSSFQEVYTHFQTEGNQETQQRSSNSSRAIESIEKFQFS